MLERYSIPFNVSAEGEMPLASQCCLLQSSTNEGPPSEPLITSGWHVPEDIKSSLISKLEDIKSYGAIIQIAIHILPLADLSDVIFISFKRDAVLTNTNKSMNFLNALNHKLKLSKLCVTYYYMCHFPIF